MKVYCIDENCPNKTRGYAICTALMDPKECPKREEENTRKEDTHTKEEANDQS